MKKQMNKYELEKLIRPESRKEVTLDALERLTKVVNLFLAKPNRTVTGESSNGEQQGINVSLTGVIGESYTDSENVETIVNMLTSIPFTNDLIHVEDVTITGEELAYLDRRIDDPFQHSNPISLPESDKLHASAAEIGSLGHVPKSSPVGKANVRPSLSQTSQHTESTPTNEKEKISKTREPSALTIAANILNSNLKRKTITSSELTRLSKIPIIEIPKFFMDRSDSKWTDFNSDRNWARMPEVDDPTDTKEYLLLQYTHHPSYQFYTLLHIREMGYVRHIVSYNELGKDINARFHENGSMTHFKNGRFVEMRDRREISSILAMLNLKKIFLYYIQENRLHGYRATSDNTSPRVVSRKRPIKASNLTSIVYLDKLPSEAKEHQGGSHSSPEGHERRKHTRTLRHPRYRNHPKYGVVDGISVKKSWVGPKEFTYRQRLYKSIKNN